MTAAISCGSAATAQAGAEVLRAGGNAVDAVIAAAFASTVAEPGVSSLGGGGFLLVRQASGACVLLDFFTSVPSGPRGPVETVTVRYAGTTQDFHVGPQTVAVPGCLDGFLGAHARWGGLPLSDVVAPAADYARQGVVLDAGAAHAMELIAPVLLLTPQIRARMAPDGHLLRAGETLVDAELAETLVAIGAGRLRGQDLTYADPVTPADAQSYTVMEREPLNVPIRGGRLLTNPLPSLGGSIVAHVLGDLAGESHPAPVALAEALVETTDWLKAQVTGTVSTTGTTHISVIDTDGLCAALTLSNGLGSGVVLPGTGIHLNNMMGEDDLHPGGAAAAVPGERIRSMMAPSLVEFDDGLVALGSGGSARIRSAMARVITLLTGHDADLARAIEAPRIHVDEAGIVQVEPGLAASALAALAEFAPVNEWPERHFYFGGVNAVQLLPGGEVRAHADPRRGGACRLVD